MSKNLLEEMDAYLKTDLSAFKKTIEKESLNKLRERQIQLQMFGREVKHQPIHITKFAKLSELINQEIQKKQAEEDLKRKKQAEEWAHVEVPKHISDLRYIPNCTTALNLKRGIYSSNDVPAEWHKLDSLTVTVNTKSGRTLKIELMKMISPDSWRQIFANPLVTFFFPLETGGIGVRKGEPIKYWRSGAETYEEEHQIVPQFYDSYLAIRMV